MNNKISIPSISTQNKKNLEEKTPPSFPELAGFVNYREFLAAFLTYKQAQKIGLRKYSYSDFAAAADLKSPQYLKLIIENKRNLSEEGIEKFAKALGLSKKDSDHFACLVRYNQATTPKERYHHLQKLSIHRAANAENLKSPHWLKVVVYSICDGIGGAYTASDLQRLLKDRCKIQDLQKCLDEMVEEKALQIIYGSSPELNLYQKSEAGQNRLSHDIPLEIIKQIQSDLLFLGLESLFIDEPSERDLGSFSIALTKAEFETVKFEVRKFRKKLLKDLLILREKSPGDRVYQVQFQVFPVTAKTKRRSSLARSKANSDQTQKPPTL